jgi:hypothetical protein
MFQISFSQNFKRKLENFEYESCIEFENLQLSFQAKVHLSYSFKVILNVRLLGFEFIFDFMCLNLN